MNLHLLDRSGTTGLVFYIHSTYIVAQIKLRHFTFLLVTNENFMIFGSYKPQQATK